MSQVSEEVGVDLTALPPPPVKLRVVVVGGGGGEGARGEGMTE